MTMRQFYTLLDNALLTITYRINLQIVRDLGPGVSTTADILIAYQPIVFQVSAAARRTLYSACSSRFYVVRHFTGPPFSLRKQFSYSPSDHFKLPTAAAE